MRYRDMLIEASEYSSATMQNGQQLAQFRVRVLESPAGEMRPEQAIAVEYVTEELSTVVTALANRTADQQQLLALGRTLGLLLLPPPTETGQPGVRDLFAAALGRLGAEEGLRLCLRLPPELAVLPWEYALVERSSNELALGFLALDPRIALVRHEPLPVADPPPHPGGTIQFVAALASPDGMPTLDLAAERAAIQQAVAAQPGIELRLVESATTATLQPALANAEIFHFAGHGLTIGGGAIVLNDGSLAAPELATLLRSNGIRLAVLGGCDTGRRDGGSLWGGTAATLVQAEIPAVIAYQFPIQDTAAIAFTRQFYAALVGGLPIERAVVAGRVAAYLLDPHGREWGTAVLYMRTSNGQLFGGSQDETLRTQTAKTINTALELRAGELADSSVTVMQVGKVKADRVDLNLSITAADLGDGMTITGVKIDEL